MDRRHFLLTSLAGTLAAPHAAEAQQARAVPRIGVLTWEQCPTPDSAFGAALREVGYKWGQTLQVLCRSGEEDYGTLADGAAALVAQNVDVLVTFSHIGAYAFARRPGLLR